MQRRVRLTKRERLLVGATVRTALEEAPATCWVPECEAPLSDEDVARNRCPKCGAYWDPFEIGPVD